MHKIELKLDKDYFDNFNNKTEYPIKKKKEHNHNDYKKLCSICKKELGQHRSSDDKCPSHRNEYEWSETSFKE